MRWFKHLSDSHNDPTLTVAREKFGDFGIAGFWILLELYAKEFSHADPDGWVSLSRREVIQKLRKRWTRVELLLNYYATSEKVMFKVNETYLKLRFPKFIDLADNFTRNTCKSQASHFKATDKQEVEVEVDNTGSTDVDPGPNPAVKVFLKEWGDTWSQRVGQGKTYLCAFGKEGAIVKELLKLYPPEDLEILKDRFFESEDSFIKQSGYTIGVFKTQIPKLITAGKQGKGEVETWIERFSEKS